VACFLLESRCMYFRKALLRCSELHDENASIHHVLADALATAPGASADLADGYRKIATRERRRARFLHALATLSEALEDDGPFLIEVPQHIAAVGKVLESTRERMDARLDAASAQSCADAIGAARHEDLHTVLLEIAEVEMRRVLRMIEDQTRGGRRTDRRIRAYRPRARRKVAQHA
jgi:hypothetical protein